MSVLKSRSENPKEKSDGFLARYGDKPDSPAPDMKRRSDDQHSSGSRLITPAETVVWSRKHSRKTARYEATETMNICVKNTALLRV